MKSSILCLKIIYRYIKYRPQMKRWQNFSLHLYFCRTNRPSSGWVKTVTLVSLKRANLCGRYIGVCIFILWLTHFLLLLNNLYLPTLLNINKLKVRGGLDNVAGKGRADELNLTLNEGFICVSPSFQGFIQLNPWRWSLCRVIPKRLQKRFVTIRFFFCLLNIFVLVCLIDIFRSFVSWQP